MIRYPRDLFRSPQNPSFEPTPPTSGESSGKPRRVSSKLGVQGARKNCTSRVAVVLSKKAPSDDPYVEDSTSVS